MPYPPGEQKQGWTVSTGEVSLFSMFHTYTLDLDSGPSTAVCFPTGSTNCRVHTSNVLKLTLSRRSNGKIIQGPQTLLEIASYPRSESLWQNACRSNSRQGMSTLAPVVLGLVMRRDIVLA